MKKIISNSILIFSLLYIVFFSANSVSAQSNFSNPPTRKLLAWSGWDKAISWFKKTTPPSKTITPPPVPVTPKVVPAKKSATSVVNKKTAGKVKELPAVIPAVVSKMAPMSTNPKPIVAKITSTTPVVVIPSAKNKIVVNEEDDQLKILQLDGTEADYSKSEGSTANFFLTVDETKYLPNVSALLRAYPNVKIFDVNSKGDYVGILAKNDYDSGYAFANIKGKIYKIEKFKKNIFNGSAIGINESGQVVGTYSDLANGEQWFLWENGQIVKLPFSPLDINNNGIVIGSSMVWKNGKTEDLLLYGEKIDKLYYKAQIEDINDNDQILVSYYYNKRIVKFLIWQNGKIIKVENLIPKLEVDEFIVIDGCFEDSPKFSVDGSLKLRVDKRHINIKIINGDEYVSSTLSHLRYYNISLPDDISTIKIQADNTPEIRDPNTAYAVPAN